MNVVVVGGALPYPANSGNRIRTLNLLVRLARRHRITLLGTFNRDRREARQAVEFLEDHNIHAVEVGPAIPLKSGPRFYLRLAANLASTLPYSVASHHGPQMVEAVRRLAVRGDVDLWQAEWAGGMSAFKGLGRARTLIMAHNVETVIWERYAATESNPIKRLYICEQARKFERFERRVFAAARRVVTVSPDDAALVAGRFGVPSERVDVVDNGIDRPFFESVVAERDPNRVLFLGSLDWRPNLDAVGWLLDTIFPAVRAAEPGAILEIVGRNPPSALVRRASATPGVVLHANVADVRPHLAAAGVLAVPLRIGGGSRLKILEALATGLPVVSSRIGAEGLLLSDGEHLDITDEPSAFADALVNAIRNPERSQALAAEGRAWVLRRYDWDVLADDLERCWIRCGEGQPAVASGMAEQGGLT